MRRRTLYFAVTLVFEVEDFTPGFNAVSIPGVAGTSHAVHKGMRDLVDGRDQQGLDRLFLFGCQRTQPTALTGHFRFSNVLELLSKRSDGRSDLQRPQ